MLSMYMTCLFVYFNSFYDYFGPDSPSIYTLINFSM